MQVPALIACMRACCNGSRAETTHACSAVQFVTCSKLASGRALLVGDAAHAMSPNLGMGCNIALQDTLVISSAISAAAGDMQAVGRLYDDARRSNAQAATRISERLDAAVTYKQHRSVLRAASGWPLALTRSMNFIPPKVPIPGEPRRCKQTALTDRICATSSIALDRQQRSALLAVCRAARHARTSSRRLCGAAHVQSCARCPHIGTLKHYGCLQLAAVLCMLCTARSLAGFHRSSHLTSSRLDAAEQVMPAEPGLVDALHTFAGVLRAVCCVL